jgi:hypothetical protein
MNKNLISFVVLLSLIITIGHAQTLDIESAVVKIADLIKSNYVFEERGKKIAVHFEQEYKGGIFDSVKTWNDFASRSTKILQEYSNDRHLFVRQDAKTVKDLKMDQNTETPAEDPFFHSDEAKERNFGFEEVKVLEGNIGYIKLSEINISEKSLPALFAAMELIANTKALIVDLRNNGGGGSEVGPVLESMFLPKNIPLLEFRSRNDQTTAEKTVAWLTQKRYTKPLFIVINNKTASAAEAFTFVLQANKRAMVVGQVSSGAAHMNSWYVVNDDLFVSISTGAPTLPGTETTWEGNGIRPDQVVKEGEETEVIKKLIHP